MTERLDQIFVWLEQWLVSFLPGSWRPMACIVLSVVAIICLFPALFALTTVFERKGLARIQNRIGPNRVGPLGILQPMADGIKSLTKEDIVPLSADAAVHFLAPVLLVVAVFMGFAVLPMGRNMVLVDMDAGLLFFFAIGASTELSVFMAGWSSRNKYSLLGASGTIWPCWASTASLGPPRPPHRLAGVTPPTSSPSPTAAPPSPGPSPVPGAPLDHPVEDLKHSPLESCHRDLDAKMVGFGGWLMPLAYPTGTLAEHRACRSAAVAFDVSHLGTVRLEGTDSFAVLQRQLSNDLRKITPGRAQYTHLLDPDDASVVDDIIVWWLADGIFDVMPNASNTLRVRRAVGGVDTTADRAVIAVQGPEARDDWNPSPLTPPG